MSRAKLLADQGTPRGFAHAANVESKGGGLPDPPVRGEGRREARCCRGCGAPDQEGVAAVLVPPLSNPERGPSLTAPPSQIPTGGYTLSAIALLCDSPSAQAGTSSLGSPGACREVSGDRLTAHACKEVLVDVGGPLALPLHGGGLLALLSCGRPRGMFVGRHGRLAARR